MRTSSSVTDICVCECSSCEHQILFQYDKSDDWQSVYCSIHLCSLTFWERLKNGIKYIFGHRSKYGDFDEFIFNTEDIPKVEAVLEKLKRVKEIKDNEAK